jgi:hypothetical protein
MRKTNWWKNCNLVLARATEARESRRQNEALQQRTTGNAKCVFRPEADLKPIRRVRSLWERYGARQAMHAAYERGRAIPAQPRFLLGPAGQRLHIDGIAVSVGGMRIAGSLTGGDQNRLGIGLEAGPFAQYRVAALSGGRFGRISQSRRCRRPDRLHNRCRRSQDGLKAAAEFDVGICAPWRRLIGSICFSGRRSCRGPSTSSSRSGARRRRAITKLLDLGRFAPEEVRSMPSAVSRRGQEAGASRRLHRNVIVPVYNGHRHVKALLGDLRRSRRRRTGWSSSTTPRRTEIGKLVAAAAS